MGYLDTVTDTAHSEVGMDYVRAIPCARVARPRFCTETWRHARRGHQLTEVGLPALLGFHLHGAHLLLELLRLAILGRLLPAVVGAASHPVGDHRFHLAHHAGLFASERGRKVELRHLAFSLAHGVECVGETGRTESERPQRYYEIPCAHFFQQMHKLANKKCKNITVF